MCGRQTNLSQYSANQTTLDDHEDEDTGETEDPPADPESAASPPDDAEEWEAWADRVHGDLTLEERAELRRVPRAFRRAIPDPAVHRSNARWSGHKQEQEYLAEKGDVPPGMGAVGPDVRA